MESTLLVAATTTNRSHPRTVSTFLSNTEDIRSKSVARMAANVSTLSKASHSSKNKTVAELSSMARSAACRKVRSKARDASDGWVARSSDPRREIKLLDDSLQSLQVSNALRTANVLPTPGGPLSKKDRGIRLPPPFWTH